MGGLKRGDDVRCYVDFLKGEGCVDSCRDCGV